MKRVALVFVIACGGSQTTTTAKTEVVPSVASVTAPSATAQPVVVVDAGSPARGFRIVRESTRATKMIARLGDREPGAMKKPLVASDAEAVCFVATGLSPDMDATCKAHVEGTAATVEADFEDDTMQSRSRTHVSMHGTLTIDPSTHAILRASFSGTERFEFRSPCEKNDDCENCDPLVKKPGCKPACFCPFRDVGNAEVETSYGG